LFFFECCHYKNLSHNKSCFKGFYTIIFHTLAIIRAKLQTASKTDVSLAEKYVSNLEKVHFFPFHRDK